MSMVGPGGTSICLVLEGGHGDPDDDVDRVPALVGLWLDAERGAGVISGVRSFARVLDFLSGAPIPFSAGDDLVAAQ